MIRTVAISTSRRYQNYSYVIYIEICFQLGPKECELEDNSKYTKKKLN